MKSSAKKHISDEVSSTTEELELRPKKLKLIIRERSLLNHVQQLDSIQNNNTILQILQDVSTFYPLNISDIDFLFRRLVEYYQIIRKPEIQLKILEILQEILGAEWALELDCRRFVKEVADIALCEINMELKASAIDLAIVLSSKLEFPSKSYILLISVASKLVTSDHWRVRARCLVLLSELFIISRRECIHSPPGSAIGRLASPPIYTTALPIMSSSIKQQQSVESPIEVERILTEFVRDADPRVRTAATRCLLNIHDKTSILNFEFYRMLNLCLSDDCEQVRIASVELVWRFASVYPDKYVSGSHESVSLRLVDDAFSRLCNSMHDMSASVRERAAVLLGKLSNVSLKFLEQTLDKKLMSNMRFMKKGTTAPRSNINQYLSEWSTGRRFGEDAPVELFDEDHNSLIPSGACGALVTGLEDEFMVVRLAAVEAVCHLAIGHSGRFINLALDFLADMFNDEIHAVRLQSINALRELCSAAALSLNDHHTQIILSGLDDASADSRQALRELLGSCSLLTRNSLQITLDALLNNLKRYPSDKKLIWQCMKALGQHHAALTLSIAPDLLGIHPYFDSLEPDLENPAYIRILILIVNAAAICPTLKSLFAGHTWRHFRYLHDSMPEFVTSLVDAKIQLTDTEVDKSITGTDCKKMTATIVEPESDTEKVIRFTAGLIVAINMSVYLENCKDNNNLRILISFPDGSTQLVKPRKSDFKPISTNKCRLDTRALLSHSVWTEACNVEICMVNLLPFKESTKKECEEIQWLRCSTPVFVKIFPKSKC